MGAEILNQDEIDALIQGVDNGAVATDAGRPQPSGEVRTYDLATQTRIVRGRMPTLEMINDRFARQFRIGLFNMLREPRRSASRRCGCRNSASTPRSLQVPSSLNLIKLEPLRGTALMVLDAKLVFAIVDNFFGGNGRFAKIEGREFTLTEGRIIQMVMRQAFADLQRGLEHLHRSQDRIPELGDQSAFRQHRQPVRNRAGEQLQDRARGRRRRAACDNAVLDDRADPGSARIRACTSDRQERDESWVTTLREETEEAEVELVPCSVTPRYHSAGCWI